ncbi:MAG: SDR family NAD(P)-dependent oxidoreductase [Spirochaetales bacterium]|uniref:SDR family NAD(P)-dependent oxidoreductase n=1 Tax=Candidatus Thalassospirochaeta sargassi TaxID=3119039 RepID=A0AAJ1MM17_9SPIO|nr:SDR family NAD(P)-dependent oxidoreductase [Spirochaetales bacterium]
MKLIKKTVVVTGGGSGIGRQLVLQLLNKGNRVAAIDVNQASLDETKQLSGTDAARLSTHVADITDRAAVCSLPEQINEIHKGIDVLINNAGIIQPFVPFNELSYDQIKRVIDINVYGTMLMIRAFLPYLGEQNTAHIVNVSSMGGFLPVPGQTLYGASKAAVKLLTEGLRAELSKTSISVSVVFPGGVSTNITRNSGISTTEAKFQSDKQANKTTSAESAAATIIKGIEKGSPRILVGKDAKLMDLLSRIAPVKAGRMMAKMMASIMEDSFTKPEDLDVKSCPDSEE